MAINEGRISVMENAPNLPANSVQENILLTANVAQILREFRSQKAELKAQNDELRQTQEILQESLDKYRDLYDLAPIGYFTMNKNGIICEPNSTGVELLGAEKSFLIGKPLSHFVAKEDQDLFHSHRKKLFESGNPQICELRLIRQDHTEFHARIESTIMLDQSGEFQRHRVVISDITEQKKMNQSLADSEEKYRLLVENSNEAILVFKDEYIKFCNSKSIELSGYRKETLFSKSIFDFIHPEDRDLVARNLKMRLRGEKVTPYVFRFIDADGKTRYVEVNAVLTKWDNEIATLNFLNDITERRKIEEDRILLARQLQEQTEELTIVNAELRRASTLKDEFLANMSHELRTPLSAILSISEALQEKVYGNLNERQLKAMHSVEESGSHLLSLINDILDISKVEMGTLSLEVAPVSVESICESSLRIIKQSAQTKQLRVTSTYDNSITDIMADGRRLKQILVNLLSNAVKFTPNGGHIGLEVIGDSERRNISITIWDTGIGIPQEHFPLLFKPFIQINSALARQQQGAGLGLTVVKNLVELHGGNISVESEVEKGSRFTVSLPWNVQADEEDNAHIAEGELEATRELAIQNEERSRTDSPLILIVEDNKINLQTVFDYLLTKDYRIAIAHNGIEAIEQAKKMKPDLVLMDIHIPDIDGIEVIHRIRDDDSLVGIRIIALTALAMAGDRERCISEGADEYLGKPFSLKTLNNMIEMQLGQD